MKEIVERKQSLGKADTCKKRRPVKMARARPRRRPKNRGDEKWWRRQFGHVEPCSLGVSEHSQKSVHREGRAILRGKNTYEGERERERDRERGGDANGPRVGNKWQSRQTRLKNHKCWREKKEGCFHIQSSATYSCTPLA